MSLFHGGDGVCLSGKKINDVYLFDYMHFPLMQKENAMFGTTIF